MSSPVCNPLKLEGPVREAPRAFETLRIAVVGTPKAGNTWLTHLLSELYDLPIVHLNADYRTIDWAGLGPRWIGQQHFPPDRALLAKAEEQGIVFVTPLRHPGDVLVSFRHFVDRRDEHDEEDEKDPESRPDWMMRDGQGVFGGATARWIERGFFLKLHQSIYWLRGGWTHGVRYEDLWYQPVQTLATLADRILPRERDAVRLAICACEIDLMRARHDPDGKLVRKGGVGGWMTELPERHQELLRSLPPYPDQIAALGYSMDPADPRNEIVEKRPTEDNPFPGGRFENGVPVAPMIVRAYFDLTKKDPTRWRKAGSNEIDQQAFHDWLLSPAAADPHAGAVAPVITEFAMYFYSIREDLRQVFPDVFGADRREFGDWFMYCAVREFRIDRSFAMPVLTSWARG